MEFYDASPLTSPVHASGSTPAPHGFSSQIMTSLSKLSLEQSKINEEEEQTQQQPQRPKLTLPTSSPSDDASPLSPPPLRPQLSLAFIPRIDGDDHDDDGDGDGDAEGDVAAQGDNENEIHVIGEGEEEFEEADQEELERKWKAKMKNRLALPTSSVDSSFDAGDDDGRRSSFEVTDDGTLKTDLFEIRRTGFKRTTLLRSRLHGAVATSEQSHLLDLSSSSLLRLHLLGRGASGLVNKALHIPSRTLLALKTIDVSEKNKRAQLMKELLELDSMYHPNIVEFHGCYYEEGMVNLALEYMNRGSLQGVIHDHGAIANEIVLANITHQILLGLQYLHHESKLHRDIKPGNMLLNHLGWCKLSDFGIAASMEADNRQTFTGTTVYMSPERITGSSYSYPADVWSIGMSLVYMATGKFPYETDEGYWGLVMKISQEDAPSLPLTFSNEIRDFVQMCLIKDPDQRWSCDQLLQHPFMVNAEKDLQKVLPHWPPALQMGIDFDSAASIDKAVKQYKEALLYKRKTLKLHKRNLSGTIHTTPVMKHIAEDADEEGGIVCTPVYVESNSSSLDNSNTSDTSSSSSSSSASVSLSTPSINPQASPLASPTEHARTPSVLALTLSPTNKRAHLGTLSRNRDTQSKLELSLDGALLIQERQANDTQEIEGSNSQRDDGSPPVSGRPLGLKGVKATGKKKAVHIQSPSMELRQPLSESNSTSPQPSARPLQVSIDSARSSMSITDAFSPNNVTINAAWQHGRSPSLLHSQSLGALSPATSADALPESPQPKQERPQSGSSTPGKRTHRHDRIVNGNLIMIDKSPRGVASSSSSPKDAPGSPIDGVVSVTSVPLSISRPNSAFTPPRHTKKPSWSNVNVNMKKDLGLDTTSPPESSSELSPPPAVSFSPPSLPSVQASLGGAAHEPSHDPFIPPEIGVGGAAHNATVLAAPVPSSSSSSSRKQLDPLKSPSPPPDIFASGPPIRSTPSPILGGRNSPLLTPIDLKQSRSKSGSPAPTHTLSPALPLERTISAESTLDNKASSAAAKAGVPSSPIIMSSNSPAGVSQLQNRAAMRGSKKTISLKSPKYGVRTAQHSHSPSSPNFSFDGKSTTSSSIPARSSHSPHPSLNIQSCTSPTANSSTTSPSASKPSNARSFLRSPTNKPSSSPLSPSNRYKTITVKRAAASPKNMTPAGSKKDLRVDSPSHSRSMTDSTSSLGTTDSPSGRRPSHVSSASVSVSINRGSGTASTSSNGTSSPRFFLRRKPLPAESPISSPSNQARTVSISRSLLHPHGSSSSTASIPSSHSTTSHRNSSGLKLGGNTIALKDRNFAQQQTNAANALALIDIDEGITTKASPTDGDSKPVHEEKRDASDDKKDEVKKSDSKKSLVNVGASKHATRTGSSPRNSRSSFVSTPSPRNRPKVTIQTNVTSTSTANNTRATTPSNMAKLKNSYAAVKPKVVTK